MHNTYNVLQGDEFDNDGFVAYCYDHENERHRQRTAGGFLSSSHVHMSHSTSAVDDNKPASASRGIFSSHRGSLSSSLHSSSFQPALFGLHGGGLDRIDEDDIRHDREDRRLALSLSRMARQVGESFLFLS